MARDDVQELPALRQAGETDVRKVRLYVDRKRLRLTGQVDVVARELGNPTYETVWEEVEVVPPEKVERCPWTVWRGDIRLHCICKEGKGHEGKHRWESE